MQRNIFIGYDSREADAYRACVNSLRKNSAPGFMLQPVNWRFLGTLYNRPTIRKDGILWDVISDAPMATEFSLARFWVPLLQRQGWALFCDCDFIFRAPIEELFALADERFAVMVVKHPEYSMAGAVKMDGQVQTKYYRKNWSSLMLLNCSMICNNDWLGMATLSHNTGFNLHTFAWLRGDLIGELPADWNHLVDVSPPHANPRGVHFTLGVPSMVGYENVPFADEWRSYATR